LALLVLAAAAGLEVTALHVDHALRPGSEAEAGVVGRAARQVGAHFVALSAPVEPGPNLEARARAARHRALPDDVALGHTADDQAETVLLALLRGSGLAGAAAMAPGPRHPLLALRRVETEAVCTVEGLRPVRDPTNELPVHRRNRVRHEVLPLLGEVAERDVVPLLCRHADHARAALADIDARAQQVDVLDVAGLRAAGDVVAAEALRSWLRSTSTDAHPPDAAAIERVLEVVHGRIVATQINGGWSVARSRGRLRLEPPPDR
jgi:tRNA(Ile)-lysidine synthase